MNRRSAMLTFGIGALAAAIPAAKAIDWVRVF
jgi:hypothetical protein